ncbi:MAG: hypothetical protein DI529_07940 [Chryseobacterium sp.]|nr:MAG: hypothetical protein DI529_07940 [Chryseobacterium sp.]
MKTKTDFSNIFSTNSSWILRIFLVGCLAMTSCNKDRDDDSQTVTTDDAAEIVTGAVSSESYGLVSTIDDASTTAAAKGVYTDTPSISCGETYSNNLAAAQSNNYFSYNYNINGSYLLGCSNLGIPQSLNYTHSMTGSYSTARIASDDSANGNMLITGISPQSQNITINGNYLRKGSETFKIKSKNVESSINMTISNLSVNKTSLVIASGTGTLSIEAKSNSKEYSFTGTIIFNGDKTATLVINGISYIIDL